MDQDTREPQSAEGYQYVMYCANHPDRETSLRCNRCEKPICAKCAIQTPTGYRCKECVRGQQRIFETAEPQDFIVAILIAGFLGLVGSLFASALGFFTLFIAPGAGAIIAELIRAAIRRRRSKRLFLAVAAATFAGSLLPICGLLFSLRFLGGSLLWQGIFAFLVTSTVYYRLSGLQLRA